MLAAFEITCSLAPTLVSRSGRRPVRRAATCAAVAVFAVCGIGCFDPTLGPDVAVACGGTSDCPVGVCFAGRCQSAASPCLRVDGDAVQAAADGQDCGDGSICVAGACVPARCGDGFVSVGEGCDEGADVNDNPVDGCDACAVRLWRADVVVRGAVDGSRAAEVPLSAPRRLVVDGLGRVFVSEERRHRVWRLDDDGTMVVVAGNGGGGYDGDGGAATEASLNQPSGVFVDTTGRLFIADRGNGRIRVVDVDGTIATVAGSGAPPPLDNHDIVDGAEIGDGGPATGALLRDPADVAVDARGRIWIADTGGRRVRRVDVDGTITTVAGTGARGTSGDGGPARTATLDSPVGLAFDAAGAAYVVDLFAFKVRRIALDGTIETVAGRGTYTGSLSNDGEPAVDAELALPTAVAFDAQGRMLIAESIGPKLRRVEDDGRLGTVFGGDGYGFADANVPGDVRVEGLSDVDVDATGRIVVADPENSRVRAFDPATTTSSTLAGSGRRNSVVAGQPATSTLFDFVSAVAVDGVGRVLIADVNAAWIARVENDGTIAHVAGTGANGIASDGDPAVDASVVPRSIAVDVDDRVVIADGNGYVWRIEHDGKLAHLAGRGTETPVDPNDGVTDARSADAHPFGVAVDRAGRVFFSEPETHRVRRIDPDGTIHTVAGTGAAGFAGDGGPASAALLDTPTDIDVDVDGRLYVVDLATLRLRVVDVDGTIRTVAGNGLFASCPDGARAADSPFGLSEAGVADDGTILIADSASGRIRRVGVDGLVTTVAGGGIFAFITDEGPATDASFRFLGATAATRDGGFVAVVAPDRVVHVDPGGTLHSIAGPVHPRGPGPFSRARLYAPRALAMLDDERVVSVGGAGRALVVDLANGVVDVAVGFENASPAVSDVARFAPLFDDPRGVAIHPVDGTLVIADHGLPQLRVVDDDLDGDGAIDDLSLWRAGPLAVDLIAPAGLAADPATGGFVVADAGNHCVVAVDGHYVVGETLAGRCGRPGSFPGYLHAPTSALRAPSGAIYVADTGNHRVLRVQDGEARVVVGDGSPSSAGEGAPARLFPVRAPQQLALDEHGNLYVASTTTVRLVANVDGDDDADGDDRVVTIFGGGDRDHFPESDALCVGALTLDGRGGVYVADACQGFLVHLVLGAQTTP